MLVTVNPTTNEKIRDVMMMMTMRNRESEVTYLRMMCSFVGESERDYWVTGKKWLCFWESSIWK